MPSLTSVSIRKSRLSDKKHCIRDMPYFPSNPALDPDTASCPVVGLAFDAREHESAWHKHSRTQLLYQVAGAVTLHTSDRVGHLAPTQAVWLPAGKLHQTITHDRTAHRSLYFDIEKFPHLPKTSIVLEVNPLLRELILRVTAWADDQPLTSTQDRLVATLLDELACAPAATLFLPMPRSKKLLSIVQGLIGDPSLNLSLAEWGEIVGASDRTLARGFSRECGLTFSQWRTQYRLLVAQTRLTEGASVTSVAHAVGYSSDSAFIAMYRRVYGQPPGKKTRRGPLDHD